MNWWHKNQKTGKWQDAGFSEPESMAALDCAYLYSLCKDCDSEHWVFSKYAPFSLGKKLNKSVKKNKK